MRNSFTDHWPRTTVVVAVLFSGCAYFQRTPKKAFVAESFGTRTPTNVAVLSFENTTLDLLAPEMVRPLTREALLARGYKSPELAAVDRALSDLGVTDGAQLKAMKSMELGKQLGVDGLLYGVIEEYTYGDNGFGIRRAVRLHLTLVRADDGEKLWEHEDLESKLSVSEDPGDSEKGILDSTIGRSTQPLAKRPLHKQSLAVITRLLSTLPKR